jgi:O-acetylhomoserine (thiol)-lyase
MTSRKATSDERRTEMTDQTPDDATAGREGYGIDTLALHAGHTPDQETLSRAVPIYQTSSYVFRDAEHAADLFALRAFGNIYTRLMNPTTDVLEKRLAAIHGGTGAVATASGQAAIFYTIAAITSAGQNFVTGDKLYGGTYTQFSYPLKRFGIEARFVDSGDPANFERAIDENTRLSTESISNPKDAWKSRSDRRGRTPPSCRS